MKAKHSQWCMCKGCEKSFFWSEIGAAVLMGIVITAFWVILTLVTY